MSKTIAISYKMTFQQLMHKHWIPKSNLYAINISNQYVCKRYVGEFLSYLCYTQDIIDFWLKTTANYQSFNKIEF